MAPPVSKTIEKNEERNDRSRDGDHRPKETNTMSFIGILEIKYATLPQPKVYQMAAPSAGEDFTAAFKGVDWGGTNERIVYTGDPREEAIEHVEFVVTDANYTRKVGLNIDDALKQGLKLNLHSLYQVPDANGTHEHKLTTKTTPGWTLRVKVTKRLSS